MDKQKYAASQWREKVPEMVRKCEALRRDQKESIDISLAEYLKDTQQVSLEDVYKDLGFDPMVDTIQNLINMPDQSVRWLIPEIYREALRLGLRKNPIYSGLIAGEQSVSGTTVQMPAINMSDATPRRVGIAETIALGDVSFGQKSVSIFKIGRGIKVPYELIQYVALNLVAIYMQDFGVKLGMGLDSLALTTLINGDQADGSDSTAVVGVATANTLAYKDLLKLWVRGARMSRDFSNMIAGEDMGVNVLDLLTTTRVLGNERTKVNISTPLPQSADISIHGQIPDNQLLIVDKSSAMIKLNAQPLLVETEKIVSNQTEATYASLTTGFATIFRDARLILDQSLAFSGNGFPAWMNPAAFEIVSFS